MEREMKRTELAYIAGLIDGEGTIGFGFKAKGDIATYTLRLRVGMSDENTIRWLQRTSGFGSVTFRDLSRRRRQTHWVWSVFSNQAASVLREVLPYLMVKKQQAELGILFQNSKGQPLVLLGGAYGVTPEIRELRRYCVEEIYNRNSQRTWKAVFDSTV
jgi:hypothetical protein